MKIYFLIEIALLLAACLTAIIVTVKNVRLRKEVADQDESISDLKEGIYADNRMITKLERENKRLRADHEKQRLLNSQNEKKVIMMREDVRKTTKEMLKKTKELCEARKKTLECLHETRDENIAILSSPLPERGRNETDAHYHQRCRQSVANKAAKYVKVADRITLKVIK